MSSVVYRGVELAGVGPVLLRGVEGLVGLPVLETSDVPRLGRHGVRRGRTLRRERIVDLEFEVAAFSAAEFSAAVDSLVAAFADVGGTWPLEVTMPGVAGGNAVHLSVEPREFVQPQTDEWEAWSARGGAVQLIATDPYYRSAVEHLVVASVAVAAPGRTYPRTYPYTYPEGGTAGVAAVFNAGNAPAEPSLRIFGPVVSPSVLSETTGDELSLDLTLNPGEFVEVARTAGVLTVMLNGTVSRYNDLSSARLPELQPGANRLRFSAAVADAGYLEVRWRDTWL